MVVFVGRITV